MDHQQTLDVMPQLQTHVIQSYKAENGSSPLIRVSTQDHLWPITRPFVSLCMLFVESFGYLAFTQPIENAQEFCLKILKATFDQDPFSPPALVEITTQVTRTPCRCQGRGDM